MAVSGAGGTMAAKPEFDPDLIRAACADGDEGAIVEFCTTLSGNLVQRETLTRQGETHLVVRGEFHAVFRFWQILHKNLQGRCEGQINLTL